MSLLSNAVYGSYLVYSPRGESELSKRSKQICLIIKENRFFFINNKHEPAIPYTAKVLKRGISETVLNPLFIDRPLLVPAPRSSLLKPGSLFPAKVICDSLAAEFQCETRILLERETAVPKASTSKKGERPNTMRHYGTIKVNSVDLDFNQPILVVDDVVTSGGMLLACVSRLKEVFPQSIVRAFALVRTMSDGEITKIEDSCIGTISLIGERTSRRP